MPKGHLASGAFVKGDRVKLSTLGLQRIGCRTLTAATRGTVTGFGFKAHNWIRVLIDGRAGPDSYHEAFWIKDDHDCRNR